MPRLFAAFMLGALITTTAVGVAAASTVAPAHATRSDGAQVPLRVYEASGAAACPPLAVLSPGAGGDERGLAYLATSLADDGWRAIVVGHLQSGRQAMREAIRALGLRQGLLALTTDAGAYRSRLEDIDAALSWARHRCKAPFRALLGHSMGAATVMIEAGATDRLGVRGRNRFDAYVALSPQGHGAIFDTHAWRDIRRPMLVITGTRDRGLQGDWHWRGEAFDGLPPGCARLAVIHGAGHLQLGGAGLAGRVRTEAAALTRAFLDAARHGRCATLKSSPQVDVRAK